MNDVDKSMATGLTDLEKHILETQQLLMVRGKVTFSICKKCHIRLQITGLKRYYSVSLINKKIQK